MRLGKTDYIKPRHKIEQKKCEFENCGKTFKGSSCRKYCEEHRKPKYYTDLYKTPTKRKRKVLENVNQIIKHSFKEVKIIQGICQCEGCGKTFDILILPNIFTYPQYCPNHRNAFKRERFLATNGKTNNSIS